MRILSRARCSAAYPCSEGEAKDLLRCSSGQPIIQVGVGWPLRCSGADPSASRKPYRNTSQFAWLASGWRIAGVRWITNRDVCNGYSNSGKALRNAGQSATQVPADAALVPKPKRAGIIDDPEGGDGRHQQDAADDQEDARGAGLSDLQ